MYNAWRLEVIMQSNEKELKQYIPEPTWLPRAKGYV